MIIVFNAKSSTDGTAICFVVLSRLWGGVRTHSKYSHQVGYVKLYMHGSLTSEVKSTVGCMVGCVVLGD